MAEKPMGPALGKYPFRLEGTLDQLTGVVNALSFLFNNKDKIEAFFPEGEGVFACPHCVDSMLAFLENAQQMFESAHRELIPEKARQN